MVVFWFKRDLRFEDNEALLSALESREKVLLLYLVEPSVWSDLHYEKRHLTFVEESLSDLNRSLAQFTAEILCLEERALTVFVWLHANGSFKALYSTEEIGVDVTYVRDRAIKKFCQENAIPWYESQYNGVVRGLKNRKKWSRSWYNYMKKPILQFKASKDDFVDKEFVTTISKSFKRFSYDHKAHSFQKGGRTEALKWKDSFFQERVARYSDSISKPEDSRYGCSRLSPYFAWGNLSIREVYQEAMALKKTSGFKRQLNAFLSRLRWQSHFIQKFEMEPRMEFEAINRGFLTISQPLYKEYVHAWKTGRTGYPLVDASIRCVVETGYINFRMRCMVTSFLTHHLFQHFTTGAAWLARQFLDFEPGIHYGQLQMQSGLTGFNTLRVYNPTKNAKDHDPEAVFIKKYVPELGNLPPNLAIEPWLATPIECELYGFNLERDYFPPIVDIVETRKFALSKLYGQRKEELAKKEKARILQKHTIPRK